MKRIIKLSEIAHVQTPPNDRFDAGLLATAREALVNTNLRWDNMTGVMRDDRFGVLESFVNPKDHTPHILVEDVLRWEFSRWINNSASRLSRGLSAV